MNETELDLSQFFIQKLESKRQKNRHYSMRAFARDLGISSGRLSDIMNKKYIPGASIADRITESLDLSPDDKIRFRKIIEQSQLSQKVLGGAYQIMGDQYSIVADWHHYAILNLMNTVDFQDDIEWIAERLNLDFDVVASSLEMMLDLNLIEMKDGKHIPTHINITTTHGTPSEAIREGHRQHIMQALHSLDNDPVELREISTIVLAVNVQNLPKVKELARDFRRKIATLLEEGEKTEVYNISMQIVPVTRNINSKT